MTVSDAPGWPAYRYGLGLFQMVVDGAPVLIYAGRTERDAERYLTMEGARVVFKFQGDVLHAPETDSEFYVCKARPDLIRLWTAAFAAAVQRGDAEWSDPAAFALPVPSS